MFDIVTEAHNVYSSSVGSCYPVIYSVDTSRYKCTHYGTAWL